MHADKNLGKYHTYTTTWFERWKGTASRSLNVNPRKLVSFPPGSLISRLEWAILGCAYQTAYKTRIYCTRFFSVVAWLWKGPSSFLPSNQNKACVKCTCLPSLLIGEGVYSTFRWFRWKSWYPLLLGKKGKVMFLTKLVCNWGFKRNVSVNFM